MDAARTIAPFILQPAIENSLAALFPSRRCLKKTVRWNVDAWRWIFWVELVNGAFAPVIASTEHSQSK